MFTKVILAEDSMSALIINPNSQTTGDNFITVDDGAFTDGSASLNSIPEVRENLALTWRSLYLFAIENESERGCCNLVT